MKEQRIRISLLALSLLAGNQMAGFAAVGPINGDAGMRDNSYYDTLGKDYDMFVQFNTNNPVQLIAVTGLPLLTQGELLSEIRGAIDTDGSGKIDGSHYATIYWDGESNHKSNFTTFNVDVTGSISSRGTAPTVRMALKGLGYDVSSSSNYTGEATLNLTFLSSGSLRSVSNVVDVGTGTNTEQAVNAYMELSGTVSGSIRRGAKATPIKIVRQSAVLRSGNVGHNGEGIIVGVDPNNPDLPTFTPYSIGLGIESIDHFDARVVQPSTKFGLVGGFGDEDDIAGNGATDRNNDFKANLRGIAHHRGPKLRMTGKTGNLVVDWVDDNGQHTGTANDTTAVTVSGALKNNIEIVGRLFGQNVDLKSGTALDAPQPGQ